MKSLSLLSSFFFVHSKLCSSFSLGSNKNISLENRNLALVHSTRSQQTILNLSKSDSSQTTYSYFAYGSNMALATMTDLRNLNPLSFTPAVLPAHKLVFNVAGIPGLEPSFASVEPLTIKERKDEKNQLGLVHGILYELSEEDFVRVCQTEGVPLSYRIHRCHVIPYTSRNKDKEERDMGLPSVKNPGKAAWEMHQNQTGKKDEDLHEEERKSDNDEMKVFSCIALTLRAMPLPSLIARKTSLPEISPSQSYLNVLIRGAQEFGLDDEYVQYLNNIQASKTIVWGNGLAEGWLQTAERRKKSFF